MYHLYWTAGSKIPCHVCVNKEVARHTCLPRWVSRGAVRAWRPVIGGADYQEAKLQELQKMPRCS